MGTHRQGGTTLAALVALAFGQAAWAQWDGDTYSSGASTGSFPGMGASSGGGTQGARFLPGVRVSQYYSDNQSRLPGGQEQGGFTTEVSPYVRASVMSRQAQGNLDFMIRNFYHTEPPAGGDSTDTLRYALRATGRITNDDGRMGVMGAAIVRDINPAPFGVTFVDPSLVQVNRRRYSSLSLSPYLTGRLGDFAAYRADYRLTAQSVEGTTGLVPQADHRLNGRLSSLPGPKPWGWSVIARAQQRDYDGGFSVGRTAAVANVDYGILPELRAGLVLSYDQIDGLKDTSGNDSGFGPGVSVDWTPTPRTSLTAKWANQYYGPTSVVNFAHRTSRWSFRANYFSGVTTTSTPTALAYNPGVPFPGSGDLPGVGPGSGTPPSQGAALPGETALPAGIITDAASFTKRLTGTIGYAAPRGSMLVTFYRVDRETAVANPTAEAVAEAFGRNILQQGIALTANRSLTARSTLNLLAGFNESESNTTNARTRLSWVQAGYSSRLTPDTTAGVALRRAVQTSNTAALSYDANTVFGTLDVQF